VTLIVVLSKVFSFDFEFSSLNVYGTHIEIAQISFSKVNNDKISNYIIYYRRLLSVESVQLKLQNEINKLTIDNLNKEINLAKKNKIEFNKLFLNKNIIKLGFGITNDIDFLTKEIPYVVVEVENDKQTTLIDQWNQLVNNPIATYMIINIKRIINLLDYLILLNSIFIIRWINHCFVQIGLVIRSAKNKKIMLLEIHAFYLWLI